MSNSNRLANISARQKSTRLREAVFAACVAVAAIVSITSVSTACAAATPAHVTQR